MSKVHVMGLEQLKASKKGKSEKPLWGVDHDVSATLQMSCCIDFPQSPSNIILFKTIANKWQNSRGSRNSNNLGTQKYIVPFLPQNTKFRQVLSKAKVFSTTHTVHSVGTRINFIS